MKMKEKSFDVPLISIVDDDLSVRRSAKRLLRTVGLRAEAFGSAEEFLASGLVDESACLILDLCMPGMNGLQLQLRLAEEGRRIPIIFLTAHFSPEEERQALKAGAVKFLQKPVNKDVLLLAIRQILKPPLHDERKIT